jgi:hypothetical protein
MAIDTAAVVERIDQLERELAELRAQLRSADNPRSYKDLYGSLHGLLSTTEEDFRECEFQIDWKALGIEDEGE